MPTRTPQRTLRLTSLALIAAIGLPLIAALAAQAFGQDDPVAVVVAPRPVQDYRILEEHETIFVSIERVGDFLFQIGNEGWILPDGTQIISHVYDPGTLDQYTRFLLRPAGPYDEESRHIVLRREAR